MSTSIESWVQSCLRKRRYSTDARAKAIALRRIRCGSPKLRIYWCRHCCGFHLTKNSLKEVQ